MSVRTTDIMGRKQRQASTCSGRVAKSVAIDKPISLAEVVQSTKAAPTKTAYARYVSGKGGWMEWAAAQDVDSSGLTTHAATRVCEYYYYSTDCFALGLSLGSQVVAAIEGHYEATTRCGGGPWCVISTSTGVASTSGNPARSTNIHAMKAAHKKALARNGNAEVDSVDVLEPVHLRAFHAFYFSCRELGACDPTAVLIHAAVTFCMSCMLRFCELAALTMPHLGQSELWPKFSLNEATKTIFKKQFYELMPWPTSVGPDPRYVSLLSWVKHCVLVLRIAVIAWFAIDMWPKSLY